MKNKNIKSPERKPLERENLEKRIAELEAEIDELDRFYKSLAEHLPHCLFRNGEDKKLVYANQVYLDYCNATLEERIGTDNFDNTSKEIAEKYQADDDHVISTGKPLHIIEQNTDSKNKHKEFVEGIKSPVFDNEGNVVGLQCVFWIITEYVLAEEALEKSESWLNTIAGNVPMHVSVINGSGEIIYMRSSNNRTQIVTSLYDLLHHSSYGLAKEKIQHVFKNGETVNFNSMHNDKTFWSHRITPLDNTKEEPTLSLVSEYLDETDEPKAICFSTDMTEQLELESEVKRNEKLNMLGLFVGGVAHDFNNLLTVVLGYAEMLQTIVDDNIDGKHHAEKILHAISRCSNLNKQLLGVTTTSKISNNSPIDVIEVINNMESILSRQLIKDIDIYYHTNNNRIRVLADRSQLEQLITNLVLNSSEAIEKEGVIEVNVESLEITDEKATLLTPIPANEYCRISVIDNGRGIKNNILKRIFEPFYTTKSSGMGLGMVNVKNIVDSFDGFIDIKTTYGEGCQVDVYLPIIDVEYQDEKYKSTEGSGNIASEHIDKTWTIIVLENDELMRHMLSRILFVNGYRPIIVKDKQQLDIELNKDQSIDLVLIDLKRLDSADIISYKLQLKEIPVVYMSGSRTDNSFQDVLPKSKVLLKPFEAKDLILFINRNIVY